MSLATNIRAYFQGRPLRALLQFAFGMLFVLLAIHPHFSDHLGPIPREYVESLTNLFLIGLAILLYRLYQRERDHFEQTLIHSAKYVGAVNRKLPLLKNLTTDLLIGGITTKNQKKAAFEMLLATAAGTVAGSEWGLLRFIETDTGRTVKEFVYTKDASPTLLPHIGNKSLIEATDTDYLSVSASERTATVKAFLIVPKDAHKIAQELPTLQAIADQAQLLFVYFHA